MFFEMIFSSWAGILTFGIGIFMLGMLLVLFYIFFIRPPKD